MIPLTENSVRSFLLSCFSETIEAKGLTSEELADDFDLLKAGIIDSLGVIEMISRVEQRFNITVDLEQMHPADLTLLGPFSRFVAETATTQTSDNPRIEL